MGWVTKSQQKKPSETDDSLHQGQYAVCVKHTHTRTHWHACVC